MKPFRELVSSFFRLKPSDDLIKPIRYDIPVDSEWLLDGINGDPFPSLSNVRVKVREVKAGWVRFSMLGGRLFQDERLECDRFLAIYTMLPNTERRERIIYNPAEEEYDRRRIDRGEA
jgi:hypothetical protein